MRNCPLVLGEEAGAAGHLSGECRKKSMIGEDDRKVVMMGVSLKKRRPLEEG